MRMESMKKRRILVLLVLAVMAGSLSERASGGSITKKAWRTVRRVNKEGPYLGLVVPNSFELNPLLQSSNFVHSPRLPFLDLAGRRFRFGTVGKEKVIVVMTGLSMLNAGISTQLLLTLFDVKGVVHFGIAGNANSDLQIGDVTIPRRWAHTGLWNWQRYGDGPNDELALEATGDYTRRIGSQTACLLGFCQQELLRTLQESRGLEAAAVHQQHMPEEGRKQFLRNKFDVTPIDMESAAVALVCRQVRVPFIAFRALSDLAGGGSSESNEAAVFSSLAAQNAVDVVIEFINLLH
ncbi:hypothetical protein ZIOFF_042524 [Zingiber officinale]|uniref:Nucleoside phosphorylase domain-containing protein n=1 Tax=Zingiber officinale TaxID=94328 RepID=A0A8J5FTE1_ZINOF|nr:hypothetical protein ZIOFF_042524 [Zingiber officinale]